MLKTLRKNTKRIIWVVILSFALWGGFSVGVQFQKKGRVAGNVFGKDVSFQEYDHFLRAVQIFVPKTGAPPDAEFLRRQAWQHLIAAREAKRRGVRVSDDTVRREVRRLLDAQGLKNFTPQQYAAWLRSNFRETPREFEEQIRDLMAVQALVAIVGASEPARPGRARELFLYDEARLSVQALLFESGDTASAFAGEIKNSSWDAAAEKRGLKPETLEKLTLGDLGRRFGLDEASAARLYKLEPGSVSAPVPTRAGFAVFRLREKNEPAADAFEGVREKYEARAREEKKADQLRQWQARLQAEARLKDYLPKYEEAPEN